MNTASILMNSTKSYFLFVCCLFILSKLGLSQHKTIVAPDDMVVSCGFQFSQKDLTDISSSIFGKVHLDSSQQKKLVSLDIVCRQYCEFNKKTGYPGPVPPSPSEPSASSKACAYFEILFDSLQKNRKYEMVWGSDGYLSNSIEQKYSLEVLDLRICNQGKILRVFSTQGPNQTLLKDTQTIWVVNCHPFYINTLDLCDPNDDVYIPDCDLKTVIYGCNVPNRDTSSFPKIRNDSCNSIGIEFYDSIAVKLAEHYFYVFRNWTITDWCQFDPDEPDSKGKFTITDTTFVVDDIGPKTLIELIECNEADTTEFAMVPIVALASDNCTDENFISNRYLIDLNDDGIGIYNGYDLQVGPLKPLEIGTGKIPLFHDNSFAINPNNPQNASGVYPVGTHKIVFTAVDALNNESRDSAYFVVEKQEPPVVICPQEIMNIPVHLPESVLLDIKTLLSDVVDNCTVYSKLKIYLDGNKDKIQDLISCEDFLDAGNPDTLLKNYKLYVEDASGNLIICPIQVNFIRLNACNLQNKQDYSGRLITQRSKKIEYANLKASNTLHNSILDQKDCNSNFNFSTFSENSGFYLDIQKIEPVTNGVDILDAYLIYKHILGHKTLSNPFDLFAADLQKNKAITAADIHQVIRLILGYPNAAITPENTWTFYNARDTVLISKANLLKDTTITCIGVKAGDLNGDAFTICGEKKDPPIKCINLTYSSLQAEKGKQYRIPITCSNYNSIIGFQSGFRISKAGLVIDTILEGKLKFSGSSLKPFLKIDSTHFNFAFIANSANLFNLAKNDILFELVFTARKDGLFNNYIGLNNQACKTVAYQEDEEALNICVNSIINPTDVLKESTLEIYPNPFSEKLQVRFPKYNYKCNLQIVDLIGREIYSTEINTFANQLLELSGNLFPHKGIYYIKLQSDEERLVKVIVRE